MNVSDVITVEEEVEEIIVITKDLIDECLSEAIE
jgi:hypothetical protein